MLSNLAESYRDVHNHLANGASALCEDDAGTILRRLPENSMAELTDAPDLSAVQPPRDYAPKGSPYATGVLNEEFGLDKREMTATAKTRAAVEAKRSGNMPPDETDTAIKAVPAEPSAEPASAGDDASASEKSPEPESVVR